MRLDESLRISPAGDSALLVELPSRMDPETSGRVIALGNAIRARCAGALRDVVLGYCSLTVYFDPLALDSRWLESELRLLAAVPPDDVETDGDVIDVPVCYGGELGPDLADVAAFANCSEDEIVAIHTGRTYRVYVVGFVPGFPYMAEVDPRIAVPRRSIPRARVAAGSVAIAAGQTGIYPTDTHGGWHLIGRTAVKPYLATRSQPFIFKPGDRVRFHAIDRREFDRTS